MSIKIELDTVLLLVKIIGEDGGFIQSQSVEAVLLMTILDHIETIESCLTESTADKEEEDHG